jgi:hypothetical protein
MAIGARTRIGSSLSWYRGIATPAMVPSTVETRLVTKPMMSELAAAVCISSFWASLRYQSSVKPTHSALSRESLNE